MVRNIRVLFNAVPESAPTLETLKVELTDIDLTSVPLAKDFLLIKTIWISLDPYMRGRMRAGGKSYMEAFALGKPCVGGAVGRVERSNCSKFKVGDVVRGFFGWESYTVAHEKAINGKVDEREFPLQDWLGKLGMPSITAYYGLFKIGKPVRGETLFISAAAGAVGQVVGQMGKNLGLHVVGSAGTDSKVKYLTEKLGFDGAFNYKTSDIDESLRKLCPKGIDIYFENVGGIMLEKTLVHMNERGRIPVCGMISQYNEQSGVKNLFKIIAKRLTLQGFIVGDHFAEVEDEFRRWMQENATEFAYETTIDEGLESIPTAFIGLMTGANLGKQLIRV